MGWTQFHLPKGTVKEWFKKTWEDGGNYEVLDSALVNRVTMFGAIKKISTGQVFAAVFMISWSNKSHYNFSYKDMTEHSGPYQHNCPERIMKLLTPLEVNEDNEFAIQWRKSVEEYWKKKNKINQISNSAVIKLEEPISFTNGKMYQFFRKSGRKFMGGEIVNNIFIGYSYVRFNLNNYQYEVLN